MPYTQADIATRRALMTPEELEEFGEEPKIEEIEKGVKVAKAQVADIGRSLAEISIDLAPVRDTRAGDISALISGEIAQFQGEQTQLQAFVEAGLEERQKALKETTSFLQGLFKERKEITAKTSTEMRAEAREQAFIEMEAETGVTRKQIQQLGPLYGQLTTLNQQAVDMETNKQLGLVAIDQRMAGSLGVIVRGEKGRYERQENIRITAKAAQAAVVLQQIQLLRGAYDDAKATSTQIVNLMMYDRKQQLDDLDWQRDTFMDIISLWSDEEKTAYNRQYDLLKDEIDKQEKEYYEKLDMRERAAEQGVTMSSTMDMPLEDWSAEYSKRVAARVIAKEAVTKMGQYGLTKAQEVNFNSAIKKGTNALRAGKPWGDVWNEIKDAYPGVPNSVIDNALGGGIRYEAVEGEEARPVAWGWAKAGAFEAAAAEPKSKWELEGDVWAWLATPDAEGLSDEEKARQIKSYGLSPETFGIYE